MSLKSFVLASVLAMSAFAAPLEKKQAECSSYSKDYHPTAPCDAGKQRGSLTTTLAIINTRGTGERQGPSSGFLTMNRNIQSQVPGGSVYNTVYPAGFNQDSTAGTRD
ncbi:hypothetical protein MBLNU230_g7120t1, partial [Neophaeotheca triangularis]